MRTIILFFAIFLCLSSCSKKIAVANNVENLHHNGQALTPFFAYKNAPAKTAIAYSILPVAGFVYGLNTNFETESEVWGPKQKLKFGGALALVGALLNIYPLVDYGVKTKKKSKWVKKSQLSTWIRKYNRTNNTNYIVAINNNGNLWLCEKQIKSEFIAAEYERQNELIEQRNQRNKNNLNTLIGGLIFTAAFLNEMNKTNPKQETENHRITCSVCHGSGKSQHMDEYRNYNACPKCSGKGYFEKQ